MTSTLIFKNLEKDTIFQKQWQSYQLVINEDYNHHRVLYAKLPDYFKNRFLHSFSVLDLGCGDVDYLSRTFANNNMWSLVSAYTGVDLSEQAVEIGKQNMHPLLEINAAVSFAIGDMLNFVRQAKASSYDVIFSSIAVHHLRDDDKKELVQEIRRILKANGVFVLIDLFLDEAEDRDDWAMRFVTHIRNSWVKLNSEQIDSYVNHTFNFDFPTKLSIYKNWAEHDSLFADVKCFDEVGFFKAIVFET
ncbi:unnamed protein product [Adineta ricciae]|nr:unnamed protein product [Adineta ricciae]